MSTAQPVSFLNIRRITPDVGLTSQKVVESEQTPASTTRGGFEGRANHSTSVRSSRHTASRSTTKQETLPLHETHQNPPHTSAAATHHPLHRPHFSQRPPTNLWFGRIQDSALHLFEAKLLWCLLEMLTGGVNFLDIVCTTFLDNQEHSGHAYRRRATKLLISTVVSCIDAAQRKSTNSKPCSQGTFGVFRKEEYITFASLVQAPWKHYTRTHDCKVRPILSLTLEVRGDDVVVPCGVQAR